MRSLKLPILCATLVATMSVATASFADDTTSSTGTKSTTGTSVMTPSSPSVPATTQTTTTVGTPAASTPAASAATPAPVTATSTTTTTAGDPSMSPSPAYTSSPDTTTVVENRRPNRALLITGGLLFAGSYVTTAAVAGGAGSVRDHDLYIPVAGPWINLATRGTDQPSNTRDTILIAGSGLLQGAGLGMAVMSFFIPEKANVATIAAGPVKMTLTPTAGGVGAVGSF